MVDSPAVKETNCPFEYHSNQVKISQNEFVIFISSRKQFMKYDIRSKKWNKYFNYNEIEAKSEDWSDKTNFENGMHIGYKLENNKIITGCLEHIAKSKILVNFKGSCEINGRIWIPIPSDRLYPPMSLPSDQNVTLFYNSKNGKFLVRGRDNRIIKIIDTLTQTVLDCNLPEYRRYALFARGLVFIDGEFHFFSKDDSHCVFDPETKTKQRLQKITRFDIDHSIKPMIYVVSSNRIMLFTRDNIWYCFKESSCSTMGWVKLLDIDHYSGYSYCYSRSVLNCKERYNLTLNGETNNDSKMDSHQMKSIPLEMYAQSILIIGDTVKTVELMVYGFTRMIWVGRKLQDSMMFPPMDLLRIIIYYYQFEEYIHLFNQSRHVRHSMLDLVSNSEKDNEDNGGDKAKGIKISPYSQYDYGDLTVQINILSDANRKKWSLYLLDWNNDFNAKLSFLDYVKKYLTDKITTQLFTKFSVFGSVGYRCGSFAEILIFTYILYRRKLKSKHSSNYGDFRIMEGEEEVRPKIEHFVIWVIRTFGNEWKGHTVYIDNPDNKYGNKTKFGEYKEYEFGVSQGSYRTDLIKWVEKYVECSGHHGDIEIVSKIWQI